MRLRKIYFILTFIWMGLICSNIYGQIDSIKVLSKITPYNKPLQFGNDFLSIRSFQIEQDIPQVLKPTQFTQDYTFKYLTYSPDRDPKRLLLNTGLYFGAAFTSFTILWFSPESFSRWDKDKIREEGFFKRWKENVRAGPVWDKDKWYLNWVIHPWAGSVYYMSARGSGYKPWESFVYATLMSTFFWEYGVEAFAEIPSWQDIILTPTLGSLLGEVFYSWKGKIIRNERKVLNSKMLGGTSLFLIDPFNEILDAFGYKTKNKIQTYSTIAPINYDFYTGKTVWGVQIVMQY